LFCALARWEHRVKDFANTPAIDHSGRRCQPITSIRFGACCHSWSIERRFATLRRHPCFR
jgi:hypothetical protein